MKALAILALVGMLVISMTAAKQEEEELKFSEYDNEKMMAPRHLELKKYVLPDLPFPLDGLEPVISKATVDTHYNKHHRTYVDNLNRAVDQLKAALDSQDLPKIAALEPEVRFNGGSHLNHMMYWENLAPTSTVGGKLPEPRTPMYAQVKKDWGSFERLIAYITARSTAIKGSGWGWLVWNNVTLRLEFMETHDQDAVYIFPNVVPLLAIDVWEHAYYIDQKNARAEYLKNIWKVVNWVTVQKRLAAATTTS